MLFALIVDPQVDFNQTWRAQEVGAPVQYPGEYEAANRARRTVTIELPGSVKKPFGELAAELGSRRSRASRQVRVRRGG